MFGIGASNIVPIIFSSAGNLPETSPSAALAFVTSLGYVGILIGPAMIGFIAEAIDLRFALSCVAGLMCLIAVSGRIVQREVVSEFS